MRIGTSAYLKLLSLKQKQMETEIRKRTTRTAGGYDFHKSMRTALRLQLEGASDAEVDAFVMAISKKSERASAKHALDHFRTWRVGKNLQSARLSGTVLIESPLGSFDVSFTPSFLYQSNGALLSVHVWNTKRPDLFAKEVLGCLALFSQQCENMVPSVLCLRSGKLFIGTREQHYVDLGWRRMEEIEYLIQDAQSKSAPPKGDSAHTVTAG